VNFPQRPRGPNQIAPGKRNRRQADLTGRARVSNRVAQRRQARTIVRKIAGGPIALIAISAQLRRDARILRRNPDAPAARAQARHFAGSQRQNPAHLAAETRHRVPNHSAGRASPLARANREQGSLDRAENARRRADARNRSPVVSPGRKAGPSLNFLNLRFAASLILTTRRANRLRANVTCK
jgi:hypothetical protein